MLCLFYAILSPIVLVGFLYMLSMFVDIVAHGGLSSTSGFATGLLLVYIILVAALYVALYGLWYMRPWGWQLSLVLFGVTTVTSLYRGS
ncbi:MAG: hypothetical protein U5K37_06280 [Natrialbaceae archaeon]|nr:hypothetical protein [Natrialbaceae archaeon]